jgi:CSLREA domain-containing protein
MKGSLTWIVTIAMMGLFLFIMVIPGSLEATTFAVNSHEDETDAASGDAVCESALGNGKCTLRAAIQEANALSGPDVIKLKAGLYMLSIAGASENDCATGDLDITDDLTITGTGAKNTFINAGQLDRVFHIIGAISVTIADLTVQNGFATDGVYPDEVSGGAILNQSENSTLTLKGIAISNNTAAGGVNSRGGGIYNLGTLVITKSLLSNSTLSNNAASGGSSTVNGGAIYGYVGTLRIKATTILNNIVSGPNSGFGGGIFNGYGSLEIRQSTVSNNAVLVQSGYGEGGGITNGGPLTIVQSTISNNRAQGANGDGGGIVNGSGGEVTITGSMISSNVARGSSAKGGGIANFWGNVVITGSTLSSNAVSAINDGGGRGGGIFMGDYGAITVQGASKILRNSSSDEGGGICYGGAGTGSVSADSTVAKNIPDNIFP